MSKILLVVVVMIAVFFGGFLFFSSYSLNEKQGEQELTQAQKEDLVTRYLEVNISNLSTESEVLGGTFYVTNIKFNDMNSGIIEYEDGHIARVAGFKYAISEDREVDVELTNVRESQP